MNVKWCRLIIVSLFVQVFVTTVFAAPPQPGSSIMKPQKLDTSAAKPVQSGSPVIKPVKPLEVKPIILLTVAEPKNGGYAEIGESLFVAWNYSPAIGKYINIWLIKGTAPVQKIVGNLDIENTVHTWMIPESIAQGSDYRVMIESVATPAIKAYSTGFFSLRKTPPGIQVMAPNIGVTWARGTTQNIGWMYTGHPGATVKITLEKPGAPAKVLVENFAIHQQYEHLGMYAWSIPGNLTPGNDYKIKIQVTNTQYADTSDQPFTIH